MSICIHWISKYKTIQLLEQLNLEGRGRALTMKALHIDSRTQNIFASKIFIYLAVHNLTDVNDIEAFA